MLFLSLGESHSQRQNIPLHKFMVLQQQPGEGERRGQTMGWLVKERRGPEWKQGWTDKTISSFSLPPFPLLAIFGIVLLFLSITHYSDYKAQMEQTMFNFHILLFLLPVLLIFAVRSMSSSSSVNNNNNNGRWFSFRMPRLQLPVGGERNSNPTHGIGGGGGGGPPWGVAALLVVLMMMISYKSSFDSQWFRPLWRRSD